MKLASGCLAVVAGFGIFRLMNKDLGEVLENYALRLHLDPENRLMHALIARVSGINHTQLTAIGAGTFFYAALHMVEGVGLLLRKRWAEYLTVVATSSLLPVEMYELARKVNALRILVFAVNIAIVIYLIVRLVKDRRPRPGRELK